MQAKQLNSKVDSNCHNRQQEYRANLQGDKAKSFVLDANSVDYSYNCTMYLYLIHYSTHLTNDARVNCKLCSLAIIRNVRYGIKYLIIPNAATLNAIIRVPLIIVYYRTPTTNGFLNTI